MKSALIFIRNQAEKGQSISFHTSSPGDTPTLHTSAIILRASETLNDAARPLTNEV